MACRPHNIHQNIPNQLREKIILKTIPNQSPLRLSRRRLLLVPVLEKNNHNEFGNESLGEDAQSPIKVQIKKSPIGMLRIIFLLEREPFFFSLFFQEASMIFFLGLFLFKERERENAISSLLFYFSF